MNAGSDLVAAHAAVVERDRLVQSRRELYLLAIELAFGSARSVAPDVLDCPVTRAAVGRLLAGSDDLTAENLVSIRVLSSDRYLLRAGASSVAISSSSLARGYLDEAIQLVSAQARRLDEDIRHPHLLGEDDGELFLRSVDIARAGLALAHRAVPELLSDLLPHVGLIAILDSETSGRLGSASCRQYPGLVVVPSPESPLEMAEAVIHEAAHQKIFDLAIARDFEGSIAAECPDFAPSWAPEGVAWPLEQLLAGWHAYTCLSRLAVALVECGSPSVDDGSLLHVAAERSHELGTQLMLCGAYLGADAHDLICSVLGRRPVDPPSAQRPDVVTDYLGWLDAEPVVRTWSQGTHTLAGIRGTPPQVFWLGKPGVDGGRQQLNASE